MARRFIELDVDPFYSFPVNLDGNQYRFRVRWNVTAEAWFLDIEGVSNTVSIHGIRLVTGVDLLAPYGESELGKLAIIDTSGNNLDPDFDNIGTVYQLWYETIS